MTLSVNSVVDAVWDLEERFDTASICTARPSGHLHGNTIKNYLNDEMATTSGTLMRAKSLPSSDYENKMPPQATKHANSRGTRSLANPFAANFPNGDGKNGKDTRLGSNRGSRSLHFE